MAETVAVKDIRELIEKTIAAAEAAMPEIEDFEHFRAKRPEYQRQVQALREEREEQLKATRSHEVAMVELKRQRARAEEELQVVLNDIGRARANFEALVAQTNRMK